MTPVKRIMLFGVLWLAATAAGGAVAWGAVRLAGEQTGDQAVRPMSVQQVEILAAATATGATTSSAPPPTGSDATTTSIPAKPTTATPSSSSSPVASPVVAARQTLGGTVVVSLDRLRRVLSLVSATPAVGYSVEIDDSGPEKVVVVFEGAGGEIKVQAIAESGEVVFSVGEDAGEGD